MRIGRSIALFYLVLGAAMFSLQSRIIFPGHDTQGRPEAEVRPARGCELVRLRTGHDVPIVALYGPALGADGRPLPDAADRPTLLYFYGNGMCLNFATEEFERFRKLGLNVMIPDYQGYGMSGGNPSERGCQDTADAAYEYLVKTRGVAPGRLIVGGWSLGGAVAIDLASRSTDRGALRLLDVHQRRRDGPSDRAYLPVRLLLRHRFDSLSKLPRVKCPILIAHGRRDRIVPFAMGTRLTEAARAPLMTFWVDEADHNDFYEAAGARVDRAILKLIEALGYGIPDRVDHAAEAGQRASDGCNASAIR